MYTSSRKGVTHDPRNFCDGTEQRQGGAGSGFVPTRYRSWSQIRPHARLYQRELDSGEGFRTGFAKAPPGSAGLDGRRRPGYLVRIRTGRLHCLSLFISVRVWSKSRFSERDFPLVTYRIKYRRGLPIGWNLSS